MSQISKSNYDMICRVFLNPKPPPRLQVLKSVTSKANSLHGWEPGEYYFQVPKRLVEREYDVSIWEDIIVTPITHSYLVIEKKL
jgi:hypothetical protein